MRVRQNCCESCPVFLGALRQSLLGTLLRSPRTKQRSGPDHEQPSHREWKKGGMIAVYWLYYLHKACHLRPHKHQVLPQKDIERRNRRLPPILRSWKSIGHSFKGRARDADQPRTEHRFLLHAFLEKTKPA